MMSDQEEKMEEEFVPARYIGNHIVDLQKSRRDWKHIDGTPMTNLQLSNGDVVMMPAQEVIGQTFFFDRNGNAPPLWLGYGRVVKSEHAAVPVEDLGPLGYEFHDGRPDFEVLETPSEQSPEAIPESITIDERQVEEEK
jgi:hypothetical protein